MREAYGLSEINRHGIGKMIKGPEREQSEDAAVTRGVLSSHFISTKIGSEPKIPTKEEFVRNAARQLWYCLEDRCLF